MTTGATKSLGTLNRRQFLSAGMVGGAVLMAGPLVWTRKAQARKSITQPDLPYPPDALEPFISARTLSFHYGKHHAGYVNKTNMLLQGSGLEGRDLETVIRRSAQDPDLKGLYNNAAQVWNHTFYWNSMKPGGGKLPDGPLREHIKADFGSLKAVEERLAEKAVGQFGSGWAWLVLSNGKLACVNTSNAETPISLDMTPLLCIDVWEHAYYLDYQNRRGEYVQNVLQQVANWEFADLNLQKSV